MSSNADVTNATFLRAFRSPETAPRKTCVNREALRRDVETGLAAAGRLRAYRDYVARARADKSKADRAARPIDREVVAQSGDALVDAKTLAISTLRLVRNLYHGGALDGLTDTLRRSLEQAGPTTIIDMWQSATASDDARRVLQRSGIDDAMRDAFGDAVRAADVQASADGSRISVAGLVDGVPLQAAITTRPRPTQPSDPADLLSRGRSEMLADAFERGEPAYLDGLGLPAGDPRAEDVALGGVLAGYHEMVRHSRKLQDIGLDTYRGASTLVIVALVACALMLAGGLVSYAECPPNTVLTEGSPDGDSTGCLIAKVLFSLGLLLLLIIIAKGGGDKGPHPDPLDPARSIGSTVIHGIVRDFAAIAS